MHKGFQIRIVSAQEQLTTALAIADAIVPKDLDQIRNHETVMRRLVELDERSRHTQPGEGDSHHALKILKHHLKLG